MRDFFLEGRCSKPLILKCSNAVAFPLLSHGCVTTHQNSINNAMKTIIIAAFMAVFGTLAIAQTAPSTGGAAPAPAPGNAATGNNSTPAQNNNGMNNTIPSQQNNQQNSAIPPGNNNQMNQTIPNITNSENGGVTHENNFGTNGISGGNRYGTNWSGGGMTGGMTNGDSGYANTNNWSNNGTTNWSGGVTNRPHHWWQKW